MRKKIIFLIIFLIPICIFCSNIDDEIQKLKSDINALKSILKPKMDKIRIIDADVRIWISKEFIIRFLNIYNTLPMDKRTYVFNKTNEGEGQVINKWKGGFGCGYFVEIPGKQLNANLEVPSINAYWDNGVSLSGNFNLNGFTQLHGRTRGPRCPFRKCQDCTIGKGKGTTVGINFSSTAAVECRVNLRKDNNYFKFEILQTDSVDLPYTLTIKVRYVGTVTIDCNFSLPPRTWIRGNLPDFFEFKNRLTIGPPDTPFFDRKYQIKLSPENFRYISTGIEFKLNGAIIWENPG